MGEIMKADLPHKKTSQVLRDLFKLSYICKITRR